MKISETRRLPDGSYDLTGRPMDEVLAEYWELRPTSLIDWDATITDVHIIRVEELVAKYGEDPPSPSRPDEVQK